MQAQQQNRRNFSRVLCTGDVVISDDKGEHRGQLVDLSLKGALVECTDDWSPENGSQHHLHIMLENAETPILMECTLAHVRDHNLGFACKFIDLDSITHLKRLIELNLGSHEVLERELYALG